MGCPPARWGPSRPRGSACKQGGKGEEWFWWQEEGEGEREKVACASSSVHFCQLPHPLASRNTLVSHLLPPSELPHLQKHFSTLSHSLPSAPTLPPVACLLGNHVGVIPGAHHQHGQLPASSRALLQHRERRREAGTCNAARGEGGVQCSNPEEVSQTHRKGRE
jgi:hypothetical protein